jgi:hypothetical protein
MLIFVEVGIVDDICGKDKVNEVELLESTVKLRALYKTVTELDEVNEKNELNGD